MTPENFCYWLQGLFEIEGADKNKTVNQSLSYEQVACIKQHLEYVFKHEELRKNTPIQIPQGQSGVLSSLLGLPVGSVTC